MLAELDRHPLAKAVLSAQNPSHAYLFYGPGGSGKREIARQLAADWLSAGDAGARARAMHGSHPDMTWVSPSGAHEILVKDIDGPVIAAATRTPFESARRVFVIESVDQLGDEAANKMLKTLEEPASFVHMILITDRLGEVMPTIRSRCQLVRFDGVDLHHVIVLLPHPSLAADVRAGEKLPQTLRKVVAAVEPNVFRHLARHRRFPSLQRTFVDRGIVCKRLIRNLGYNLAVVKHAQLVAARDLADFNRIESPLFKNAEDFVLAAFLGDQQHALLRFAQHDFVCGHASLALRHAIEFDFDAHAAARAHLAS